MNRYDPDYDIDVQFDYEAVLECDECGSIHHRAPTGHPFPVRRTCENCDDRTLHSISARTMQPSEAAAELCRRHLDGLGVVERAHRLSNKLMLYISDQGVNLSNVEDDYDFDVHEVGPIEAYNEHTRALATEGTEVYLTGPVEGILDDARGYALPTHYSKPGGTHRIPESEIDTEVHRLGVLAEGFTATENQ